MNENIPLKEDQIFSILAHPVRRRILSEIFSNGYLSFSIMSKEWKIATGTLYHHLNTLKPLVTQNDESHYILTEEGFEVSKWFLKSDKVKLKVQKIDTYSTYGLKLVDQILNYSDYMLILAIVVILLAVYLSASLQVILLGPMIVRSSAELTDWQFRLINITITILIVILIQLPSLVQNKIWDKKQVIIALFSIIPSFIIIIALYLLSYLISVQINEFTWILISIIFQIFYVILNNAYNINYNKLKLERSILTILLSLYLIMWISTYI